MQTLILQNLVSKNEPREDRAMVSDQANQANCKQDKARLVISDTQQQNDSAADTNHKKNN